MEQSDNTGAAPQHVLDNVEAIAELHARAEQSLPPPQRRVERLAAWAARPRFLLIILTAIAGWVAFNLLAPAFGVRPIDAPPFGWMQTVVSITSLILAGIIVVTQHRQGKRAEVRAHLDLQLNLMAEQKIAKLIALVEELRRDLPEVRDRHDPEAEAMKRPADPEVVVRAIRENLGEGDGEVGAPTVAGDDEEQGD